MDRMKKIKNYSFRMCKRLAHREHATELTTHIKTEYRRVTWTIQNADKCHLDSGECLESPIFSTGFTNITKWCLRLYPNGKASNSKVGLFLFKITPSTKVGLEVRLLQKRLALSDLQHQKVYTKSEEIGRNTIGWGMQNFGSAVLEIVCEMKVSYIDDFEDSASQISESHSNNCTLSSDFKELYDSEKYTDVVLRFGAREVHVHKSVLAARSPVFSAMFEHTMSESMTNTVAIDDVEPCIIDYFLQHIYTGKIDKITFDEAILLYKVSEKYDLIQLKNECLTAMLQNLTVQNVCIAADFANIYSDSKLKDATNYYFRNYSSKIFETQDWKTLVQDKPLLASEVLKNVASDFITKC